MADITPRDLAQRGYSLFLRRLATVKAGDIAKDMGVSDGRVSELKNKQIEDALILMAHLGLKVVASDMKVMPADTYAFLTRMHQRVVTVSPELAYGNGESDSSWGSLS